MAPNQTPKITMNWKNYNGSNDAECNFEQFDRIRFEKYVKIDAEMKLLVDFHGGYYGGKLVEKCTLLKS